MKRVYWVRVWRMDWWGVYDDSPDFDTLEEARCWLVDNVRSCEDFAYMNREVKI